MKGTLMFDNLNDLAFFDADDELAQHIQNLAIKDGLLEESSFRNSKGVVDKNIIMQLFSPLIASYKVMQAQFGNKYKSIESEDGVLLVFNEVLNYVVIGVSSTEENLEDVEKEISFFLVLVRLLYGPSLHMIKKEIGTFSEECSRSELLSQIVNKWRILKVEQQMFLVEGIERLIVNQDINSMCVNVLQETLERIRSSQKVGSYCHAFILVDTKLLAFYSSRNSAQLPKEQLLLLILISQVMRSSFAQFDELAEEVVVKGHDDEQFFVPAAKSDPEKDNTDKNLTALGNSNKKEEATERFPEAKDEIKSLLIYLKTSVGSLVPYMVYAMKLTYKITSIILCEHTNEGMASSCLHDVIESLYNLQQHPSARKPVPAIDNLEFAFKALIDSLWKLRFDEKEAFVKKLISKWEQMKHCGLASFLDDPNSGTINARLDSSISSLCEFLRNTFEEVLAVPLLQHEKKMQSPEQLDYFFHLQKYSLRKLKDTADFLEVKAVQNVTMSSYVAQYPGLIHFIYIDRTTDYVIAPAVVLKKGHLNGTTSLKNKIWKMVAFGKRHVDGANKYCCLWKESDLYYLYHIWFEDSAGRIIKPTRYPNIKKWPPIGILCGNFYKKLVQECFPGASYDHIFCYELFSAHLESTPVDVIIDHSRRLCSQLWDFTGLSRTSLELL